MQNERVVGWKIRFGWRAVSKNIRKRRVIRRANFAIVYWFGRWKVKIGVVVSKETRKIDVGTIKIIIAEKTIGDSKNKRRIYEAIRLTKKTTTWSRVRVGKTIKAGSIIIKKKIRTRRDKEKEIVGWKQKKATEIKGWKGEKDKKRKGSESSWKEEEKEIANWEEEEIGEG